MPVGSGYTWEIDPDGDPIAGAGMSQRQWVRATQDHRVRGMAKSPKDTTTREIYGIGMERVAWTLGTALDLPIPQVWLDRVQGAAVAVVERILNQRNWRQAHAAPMLLSTIDNEADLAVGVAFDIWLANADRADRNLVVEPMPPGTRPGVAGSCRVWLVDHGLSGLLWARKWDDNLDARRDTAQVSVGDGRMLPQWEQKARRIMPDRYREAFTGLDAHARAHVLDAVRAVTDDQIEQAVSEIPSHYFTSVEAEKTVQILKARRHLIDTLSGGYW